MEAWVSERGEANDRSSNHLHLTDCKFFLGSESGSTNLGRAWQASETGSRIRLQRELEVGQRRFRKEIKTENSKDVKSLLFDFTRGLLYILV